MLWPMKTKEVLEAIALLPPEEWVKIQSEVAEMIASQWSEEERNETLEALQQSEAEFAAGKGIRIEEVRRQFGLE